MAGGHPLYDYAVGLEIDQRAMVRAIKKQETVLRKTYDSAMSAAVEANFSRRKLRGLEKTMNAATKQMASAQMNIQKLGLKLRQQGLTTELKDRYRAQLDELKLRRKLLREEGKERAKQAKDAAKEYRAEMAKDKARAERRAKAMGRLGGSLKAGAKAGEGISGAVGQFASGDIKGLAESLGKALKSPLGKAVGAGLGKAGGAAHKGGKAMAGSRAGKAAAMLGGGVMLKGVAKLGKALSAMLPALLGIAMVVGALALLVKVFLDADKLVKEMNSSLLKSNVVASDLGANWMDLDDRLTEVRESFSKFSFLNAWKMLPKESMKIVDAYGAAGVKVSQFTAGIEDANKRQEKLRKTVETSLIYANLLGMTGTEVATKMGEYMDNLAVSLDTVRESFSGIYRVANESGYSTKKFFGMVLQATSGLTMYNVRLSQTAELLKELTGALGLKDGFAMLQKILGQMKGKSITEKAKDIIVTGGVAQRRKRFRREAEEQAKTFLAEISKQGIGSMFEGAADASGVKLDISSAEALIKSMQGISQDQFKDLLGNLNARAVGKGEKDQVRAFQSMFQHLIPGLRGDAMNIAGAESKTGPVYALLTMFDKLEASGKLAKMSGGQIEGYGLQAAEKLGIDNETAQNLATVMTKMVSDMRHMQNKAKEMGSKEETKGQNHEDSIRQFGAMLKWNDKTGQADVIRAKLDHFGDIIEGGPIKSMADWLYSQKDVLAKLTEKGENEDTLLARGIASSTTEATKILSAMKDGVLMSIFKGVQSIIGLLMHDQVGEATQLVRKHLNSQMDEARSELTAITKQRQHVSGILPNVRGAKRDELAKHLARLETAEKTAADNLDAVREALVRFSERMSLDPEGLEKRITEIGKARNYGVVDRFGLNDSTKAGIVDEFGAQTKYLKKIMPFGVSELRVVQESKDTLKRMEEEAKKAPEKNAKALLNLKGAREIAISEMASKMSGMSPQGLKWNEDNRKDFAKQLVAGNLSPTRLDELKADPSFANKILGIPGLPPEAAEMIRRAIATPAAKDMIMGLSGGRIAYASRVDTQDQAVKVSKKGGAFDGMGGGATHVTNNFMEGKSAFSSMRDWEKAKGKHR